MKSNDTKQYNIAVVGATGLVGETLLDLMLEREFPVGELSVLASARSAGEMIFFDDEELLVESLEKFDFKNIDFAFFCTDTEISKQYVPIAVKAGCVVIDKSNAYRLQKDIPLIIPEINPHALKNYRKNNIIANPNCSTIPILVAVKPILDFFGLARMNIATYQSVSGVGKKGIEALATETADLLNGQNVSPTLEKQIAFNVIPKIDDFCENAYTREEMKLILESRKILNDDMLAVNVTAVRVPVFFGHSAVVHLETKKKTSATEVRALLKKIPEITVLDQGDFPTPAIEATNSDSIYVGRIRDDISHSNGINLWVTADNVRKGAALNALQIVEMLIAMEEIA